MKFSVITVTYQNNKGLKKTLKSLSKLDKNIYELIVIDGGSSDQTLQTIKNNTDLIDKWISEPDKGIYDAMNKGLKLVDNKDNIVSFLNAGDLALQNYFEEPKNYFLKDDKIKYCYGGIVLVGKKKESVYMPKILNKKTEYLQRMAFPHPSLFVKKSIYHRIGDFNLNKKFTADHEWCVRLVKSEVKGARYNNPVVKFELGGASLKLIAQFEVFKTAIDNKRNIILALIFFTRQLLTYFYYILRSKL